jgi:hypothetical protein
MRALMPPKNDATTTLMDARCRLSRKRLMTPEIRSATTTESQPRKGVTNCRRSHTAKSSRTRNQVYESTANQRRA